MKIDTDHIHYWMSAIRQSPDPMRTLEAFWKGQIESKEWLVTKLRPFVFKEFGTRSVSIDIFGGWVGILASMLFQSDMPVSTITSIDIDHSCENTANIMNQIEFDKFLFKAVTADMTTIISQADIVINTSCEHITQEQFQQWMDNMPFECLYVLQSNNYKIEEHIRIAESLEEFEQQCNIKQIFYSGELTTPEYKRWMIIGKNV